MNVRRVCLVAPLLLATAVITAAMSSGGPLSSLSKASGRPASPNLTLSFDANPPYSEFRWLHPGFKCVNGVVSGITKPASAAFVRDARKQNVRHGKYSAKVVLKPGDHASYTCRAEAVEVVKPVNEGEGSESWWGWSWKIPHGWRGTAWRGNARWGMLFEFTVNADLWPSYGMLNFDAATRDSLRLGLHTGLTPNPGSGSYNSAYEKLVTLLGPGAPRPMVYGKWLDFYMHVVWRSHRNGILQIWYRTAGKKQFTKLYSDIPGDGALIQAPPHPTLLYNTVNGAPGAKGKGGLELAGGFYRPNTPWTNTYWWDGLRRRQSKAAILAEFPNPPPRRLHPRHSR